MIYTMIRRHLMLFWGVSDANLDGWSWSFEQHIRIWHANHSFHIRIYYIDFTQKCMHFWDLKWKMNSKSFSWTICICTFKSHPLVKFLPHWSQLVITTESFCFMNSCYMCNCVIFATLITFVFFKILHGHFQYALFKIVLSMMSLIDSYAWDLVLIFSISWTFCLCTFKLNDLAKNFPHWV